MADPREQLSVHGLLIAGFASVVAATLSIVYFLDHPYQPHVGGIQPTAMRQTLTIMQSTAPNPHPGCGLSGRPA